MKTKIEAGFAGFFYDSLLSIVLYLVCVSLPSFVPGMTQEHFAGIARWAFLPFVVFLLLRTGQKPYLGSPKRFPSTLPLFLICFGNMAALLQSGSYHEANVSNLLWRFFFTLATAFIEEAAFRFGLLEAINKTGLKKFSILISAFIFGVMHLFALFTGSAILPTLAQAGYTFILGLLLGVAYTQGGFLSAFLLHFAFNFLQNDLYSSLGGGNWDVPFFIWNIGLGILSLGYGAFLYFRYLRKKEG